MLQTTIVGPEINNFGYNFNGAEMVGHMHLLNMTLCWVAKYTTVMPSNTATVRVTMSIMAVNSVLPECS